MCRHSVYFNLNMLISLPCYISDFSVKWYLMELPNCNFFRSLVQFVFLESWKRKRLEAMSKQNIILSLNPCKSHVYTYLRLCACKFSKGLQQSDQAIVWLRNCRVHEILHKAEFINAGALLHSYPGQLTVSQQWWSHVSQLCTNTYTNIPNLVKSLFFPKIMCPKPFSCSYQDSTWSMQRNLCTGSIFTSAPCRIHCFCKPTANQSSATPYTGLKQGLVSHRTVLNCLLWYTTLWF